MLPIPDKPMFYDPNCQHAGGTFQLTNSEAHHAIHVLRLKEGDEIVISNGQGGIWLANIIGLSRKDIDYTTTQELLIQHTNPFRVSVACGVLGNTSRMETMVEKMVEIGVNSIYIYSSDRTGKHRASLVRLKKVAMAALKQSRKTYLPKLEITSLEELIKAKASSKIAATCLVDNLNHLSTLETKGDVLMVIGPEGDFTERELQLLADNDFRFCSLGSERLRSETAAIYALICENLKTSI